MDIGGQQWRLGAAAVARHISGSLSIFYGGQQDDRNADLVTGFIAKNQAYFANAMYRLAPNVMR